MIKKIISSILVVALVIALTFFSVLQIAQDFLSIDNIIHILNVEEKDNTFGEKVLAELSIDTETEQFIKYVDNEKFERELASYINKIIIYSVTNNQKNKPTSENIRQVFKDAENKYQKENNKSIDNSIIEELLNSLDEDVDTFKDEIFKDNDDVKKILTLVYSPIKNVSLIIAISIIILIFILNRNVILSFIYPAISFIINGISLCLIGFTTDKFMQDEMTKNLLSNIITQFYKYGIICLAIGIILISIRIIYKKKSNSKSNQ